MNKIAFFPGSFDPITIGHEDIIIRVSQLFEKVIVGIGKNQTKNSMFSYEQKKMFLEVVFSKQKNIEIVNYAGLTIDYCKKFNIKYLIRGLRSVRDFEYEKDIEFSNKLLYPEIEIVYFNCIQKYMHISSTIVRDIIKHKGDLTYFVPKSIQNLIYE